MKFLHLLAVDAEWKPRNAVQLKSREVGQGILVLTNMSSSWCQAEDNRCTSSLVPVLPSILLCVVGRNVTVSTQVEVCSRDWARGSLHDYNGAQTVPRPNTSLKLNFLEHQSFMGSSLGHFGLSRLMEIWPMWHRYLGGQSTYCIVPYNQNYASISISSSPAVTLEDLL